MSRREVAEQIAEFVVERGMVDPFGGEVYETHRRGRKIYGVAFSVPRVLDGSVEVYGETFVRVVSRGALGREPAVCRSVEEALEFLGGFVGGGAAGR